MGLGMAINDQAFQVALERIRCSCTETPFPAGFDFDHAPPDFSPLSLKTPCPHYHVRTPSSGRSEISRDIFPDRIPLRPNHPVPKLLSGIVIAKSNPFLPATFRTRARDIWAKTERVLSGAMPDGAVDVGQDKAAVLPFSVLDDQNDRGERFLLSHARPNADSRSRF